MKKIRLFSGILLVILILMSLCACINSNYSSNDNEQRMDVLLAFNSIIANSDGRILGINNSENSWSEITVMVNKDFIGSVRLNTNWNTDCYGKCIVDSIKNSGIVANNSVITVNYYLNDELISVYSSKTGPKVYYKFE
uniref:Lipoprotein n=1 Tax=Methanococcus maripaludis (strain C6 / ATCC BAA-1332) TaxID=444158 RepID=A9AAX2_METM6